MTIYNVVADFYVLKNLSEEAMTDPETGEVRELTEQENADFLTWINESKDNLETKMNNISKVYSNKKAEIELIEAEIKVLKDEIDRLNKKKKARENEANRIKNLLAYALEKFNFRKFKTFLFTIYYQKTAKSVKTDSLFNLDKIPVDYLRRELSPSAIKKAVDDGQLYESDNPLFRGKLFYREDGIEKMIEGVSYLAGKSLVVR